LTHDEEVNRQFMLNDKFFDLRKEFNTFVSRDDLAAALDTRVSHKKLNETRKGIEDLFSLTDKEQSKNLTNF
jgi:hypothetical protein